MGVTQVHLFKHAEVRRFFGLTPMVTPEQAKRDAIAAGLVKEEVKTIDVKAKSYPADQRPVYQAPNVKFAAPSTPSNQNATSTSAGAALQASQSPFDSVKGKGFGLFNKAGEQWDAMKKGAQDAVMKARGSASGPKSKTRSAEFMKAAEDYERKWQKFNKK